MSKHWNPGCAMKNCMTVICEHADGALPELRHSSWHFIGGASFIYGYTL